MHIDVQPVRRKAARGVYSALNSLGSLTSQLPAAYQILEYAGVHTRRARRRRLLANAGWLGGGLLVGTGLALLLTPRTGREIQADLRRTWLRARDRMTEGTHAAASANHREAQERSAESPRSAHAF